MIPLLSGRQNGERCAISSQIGLELSIVNVEDNLLSAVHEDFVWQALGRDFLLNAFWISLRSTALRLSYVAHRNRISGDLPGRCLSYGARSNGQEGLPAANADPSQISTSKNRSKRSKRSNSINDAQQCDDDLQTRQK